MTGEVWRPWECGTYEVSSLGRVRNAKTGRVLRGTLHRGIRVVALRLLSRDKASAPEERLGYMVLTTFDRDPREGEYVRHRDGDRENCAASNLYWGPREVTPSWLAGVARGSSHYSAKLTEKHVLAARRRARAGEAVADLAREHGVSRYTMYCAVTGKTWRHLRP